MPLDDTTEHLARFLNGRDGKVIDLPFKTAAQRLDKFYAAAHKSILAMGFTTIELQFVDGLAVPDRYRYR